MASKLLCWKKMHPWFRMLSVPPYTRRPLFAPTGKTSSTLVWVLRKNNPIQYIKRVAQKRSGFLENKAIKQIIAHIFRHEFLTSPQARKVAATHFYPLPHTTVVFVVTLVCSESHKPFACWSHNANSMLKIYHILQQFQSGSHVDISFSSDRYQKEYQEFEAYILKWIEKRGDQWDVLSRELGCVAL